MKTSCRWNGAHLSCGRFPFATRFVALLFAAVAQLIAVHAQSSYATPYTFSTLAGSPALGNGDGIAGAASFYFPVGIVRDAHGNMYVGDYNHHTIRKISPAGAVTTFAGIVYSSGSNDGTADTARFNAPWGVAIDSSGNLFVSDSGNHSIRKITPDGVVTTFAGAPGSAGLSDGTGRDARFYYPKGLGVDQNDNVYVADSFNHAIRKITPAGVVSTLAGYAASYFDYGSNDGTGSAAKFWNPCGLAVDNQGNVFVADTNNHTVRKVTAAGVVTTVAGRAGMASAADGVGSNARFNGPKGVTIDGAGVIFVADTDNHTIRKINPDGIVSTIAGNAGTNGYLDGTGSTAQFNSPGGLALDTSGNVLIADSQNGTIRIVSSTGSVATLAGVSSLGSGDGTGGSARFFRPQGVAVDSAGFLYVADMDNNTIKKISPEGVTTTFAGAKSNLGTNDGIGSAAGFIQPRGIAIDATGNLYVATSTAIRKITPDGAVSTLAGGALPSGGYIDAYGVAVDTIGNVYATGPSSSSIRKISPAGLVTLLAAVDGAGAVARFNNPRGVAVDNAGNIYVADTGSYTIRKISTDGLVTTLAGAQGIPGAKDGVGGAAQFRYPYGLSVDGSGNVYVADASSNNIRKITAAGVVTTLAGVDFAQGIADGSGSDAKFYGPNGIAVDSLGNLYVTDSGNNTIRKGVPSTRPTITVQPVSQTVVGGYSVIFGVTASGSPPPTYQWLKNGVNISGATGGSYTIADVKPSDAGNYAVVMTNGIGSVTSNIAMLKVTPAGFDFDSYYARYPDVAVVYGADHYGAWLYYHDHGIYDGEVFDDLFRVEEYLTLYPELFAVFGSDLGGALDHWLSTGRIEGRLGRIPLEFSATGYLSRNPDVAAAVNNDALLAWSHYWSYGIYEGRAYDEELRVFEYLAVNADLTAAFVSDWRKAALHWMRYGRTEGRLGRLPLLFNVTEYLNRSPDVAAAWGTHPTTVFLHYWSYGIDEGRTFDDEFRPADYLALNADLAAVFGTDLRGAFKHWVRYGKTEGRPGKKP